MIFIIENNGYGLSTPVSEQYRCSSLAERGKGYGMEAITIDGNNVLTVYDTVKGVREYCIKNQKPYLIECMTFRMRGHEEASGTKYIPKELFEEWEKRDPIKNYEQWLMQENILTAAEIINIRNEQKNKIEEELKLAAATNPVIISPEKELQDVYAKHGPLIHFNRGGTAPSNSPGGGELHTQGQLKKETFNDNKDSRQSGPQQQSTPYPALLERAGVRFIDAIKEGLHQSMKQHPNLILMGQDIAEYGGAFKITEGFIQEFGKDRLRNTPLCESAIIGAALG